MTVSADEILDYATKIIENSCSECEIRNGAGRAYYSAFHFCEVLSNKFPTTTDLRKKGSHIRLADQFIRPSSLIDKGLHSAIKGIGLKA